MADSIIITHVCNLDKAQTGVPLKGALYATENQAHTFVITGQRSGVDVAFSGSVTGVFMRADGGSVELSGSIEGGAAVITLAQSCYTVEGRFTLTVFNVDNGIKTTIFRLTGQVARTTTDTIIDPGHVVPDVDAIIAKFDEMEEAIEDCEAATDAATAASEFVSTTIQANGEAKLITNPNSEHTNMLIDNDGLLQRSSSTSVYGIDVTGCDKAYVQYLQFVGTVPRRHWVFVDTALDAVKGPTTYTAENVVSYSNYDTMNEAAKWEYIDVPEGAKTLLVTSDATYTPTMRAYTFHAWELLKERLEGHVCVLGKDVDTKHMWMNSPDVVKWPGQMFDLGDFSWHTNINSSGNHTMAGDPDYWCTGYLPVTAGETYKANHGVTARWYDSSYAYLGYDGKKAIQTGVTAPENAAYMIVTFLMTDTSDPLDVYIANVNDYDDSVVIPGLSVEESDPKALSMLADEYDPANTYLVGEYCLHDGGFYRCGVEISTAEAWTAAHWFKTTLGDAMNNLARVEIAGGGTVYTGLKACAGDVAHFDVLDVSYSGDEIKIADAVHLEGIMPSLNAMGKTSLKHAITEGGNIRINTNGDCKVRVWIERGGGE